MSTPTSSYARLSSPSDTGRRDRLSALAEGLSKTLNIVSTQQAGSQKTLYALSKRIMASKTSGTLQLRPFRGRARDMPRSWLREAEDILRDGEIAEQRWPLIISLGFVPESPAQVWWYNVRRAQGMMDYATFKKNFVEQFGTSAAQIRQKLYKVPFQGSLPAYVRAFRKLRCEAPELGESGHLDESEWDVAFLGQLPKRFRDRLALNRYSGKFDDLLATVERLDS